VWKHLHDDWSQIPVKRTKTKPTAWLPCSNFDFLMNAVADRGTNIDDAVSFSRSLDDTSKTCAYEEPCGSKKVKKMAVFWVVAPCCLVEVYQRFRGPCCLHHQGDDSDYTALQPRRQPSSYSPPWEPQILLCKKVSFKRTRHTWRCQITGHLSWAPYEVTCRNEERHSLFSFLGNLTYIFLQHY
jgi:hypothetical protein